jgi:hypothetical protein
MVLWRSQADEIDALRAEVRNLRGEMAAKQAELKEMDTLVERMVLCDSKAHYPDCWRSPWLCEARSDLKHLCRRARTGAPMYAAG